MKSLTYHEKVLLNFFGMGQEKQYVKDEVVVYPNEEPGGVFLIKSGYVTSYTLDKNGECNALVLHQPGEIFPLSAVMQEQLPTTYHQAKSDVVLLRLSRAAFWSGIHGEDVLSQAVTAQLLNLLLLYELRIKQLSLRTARERIMACLYISALRYGSRRGDRYVFEIPLTHQDLADLLNMTRETASRELEHLSKEKLIQQDGRQLIVNNLAKLSAVFD